MITNQDCLELLEQYSIEVPDIALNAFVERINTYDLTKYTEATQKALGAYSVCYLSLAGGTRVLSSRGADGKSQAFKNDDALARLKRLIKNMDSLGLIKGIFVNEGNVGFIFGVKGYE